MGRLRNSQSGQKSGAACFHVKPLNCIVITDGCPSMYTAAIYADLHITHGSLSAADKHGKGPATTIYNIARQLDAMDAPSTQVC